MHFSVTTPFKDLCLMTGLLCAGCASVPSHEQAASLTPAPSSPLSELRTTIPIVAWWGIPDAEATAARYQEMAEAGFTWAMPQGGDPVVNREHLKHAAAFGIKLMIQDGRLATAPAAVIEDYKNFSGLGAYVLQDEPNAKDFPALAKSVATLHKLDPAHFPYINLLPTYASPEQLGTPTYPRYLAEFIAQVKPDFVSYDHYTITTGSDRPGPDYFLNLKLVRDAAVKAELPFWAFVRACTFDAFPTPTDGGLRFTAFCSLAYGARGIEYFTYWTPTGREEAGDKIAYKSAIIDRHGQRTATFALVKKLNREITAWAPTLTTLRPFGVCHSDPAYEGTEPLGSGKLISALTGSPVLVGFFRDPADTTWAMVVNSSFCDPAKTKIAFDQKVSSVFALDKNSGQAQSVILDKAKTMTIELAPGDAVLLKLEQ